MSARGGNFARDAGGGAALEFALWMGIMIVPILNVIDVGVYLFQRVQVENSAQMAANAAWAAWPGCTETVTGTPTNTSCTAMSTAATTGGHSTSLATNVTVNTPQVGNYCVASGVLTPASSCAVGATTGTYVTVTVSRTYTPLFSPVSVTSAFGNPLTLTTWARVK